MHALILSVSLLAAFIPLLLKNNAKFRKCWYIISVISAIVAIIIPLLTPVDNSISGFSFPYIPGLDEYIRIFPIHVPFAWLAVLAFIYSLVYSILYLRNRNLQYDFLAANSIFFGTLFCLIATITGMIWANHSWGTYWNWDPRQTSIAFLLLIYFAYFALRSAIGNKKSRASLSAVYAIITAIVMPFFVFILPRMTGGLHPGSGSTSPLNGGQSILDSNLLYSFSFSLFALTSLFIVINDYYARKSK